MTPTLGASSQRSDSPSMALELVEPGSLTVDGKLEEGIYGKGLWQTHFRLLNTLESWPYRTEFRLFTDRSSLYFAARMEDPSFETVDPITERDGPVWRNDAMELFIQANEDRSTFLHILVNRFGAVADIEYGQGGGTRHLGWNASVIAKVGEMDSGWTVEMKIPLAELKIDPSEAEWLVQVARDRSAREGGTAQTATWAPTPDGLHKPQYFGRVELPNFERELLGWKMAADPFSVVREGDEYYLRQSLAISNETGNYRTISVNSALDSDANVRATATLGIAAGKGARMVTEMPLGKNPRREGVLRHEIALSIEPGHALAVFGEAVSTDYVPFVLRLVRPGYRAAIFSTQNLDILEADLVRVDQGAEIDDVRAVLQSDDGSKRLGHAVPVDESRWRVTVPDIGDLPVGNYRLVVDFRSSEGESTIKREIRKLPRHEGEIWIDEKGVVYRDGKPLPAYGFLFGRWDEIERVKVPGMFLNVAAPLWAVPPFEKMNAQIARLASQGVYSGIYVPTASKTGLKLGAGKTPLSNAEIEEYNQLARQVRDNPNVIFYYLYDEPEGHGIHPSRMRQIYEILREEDPWRPVVVLNDSAEGVRDFQYGGDISNPDPYPLFTQGGGSARPLDRIGRFLDEITTGEESFRAKWLTPQAFNYSLYNVEGNRGPTAAEMRSQQIIGLIHGAVGFTWYPEYMAWEEPGVFTSLPYLSQEYLLLFPLLINNRPEILNLGPNLEAGWWRDGELVLLMVVNTLWEERDVTLKDKRFKTVSRWKSLGHGVDIPGNSEELAFRLRPYEGVILASEAVSFPDDLDWKLVESAEAKARSEVLVPGNVAHVSLGAKARGINTTGSAYLRPMILIDGMKDPRGCGFVENPFQPGVGVEIDFGQERSVSRVNLLGANIAAGQINILGEAGKWKEVAQIKSDHFQDQQQITFQPQNTRGLQVIVSAILPGTPEFSIREIEVYEN